ncbi:hypothetical protein [Mesorhizobium sp.]|uniref:hypothetical protein n=1 Tax=Mesorhizobium sp. TaxID=1871066 RepID=UPI000FE53FD6|nr:hypothetical protein [Mesorhizobium sp.]RWP54352.1 MAG: hypothetical protein EOR06_10835 [Mesorhizobium sp.]
MLHAAKFRFRNDFVGREKAYHVEQPSPHARILEMALHSILQRQRLGCFIEEDMRIETSRIAGIPDRLIVRVDRLQVAYKLAENRYQRIGFGPPIGARQDLDMLADATRVDKAVTKRNERVIDRIVVGNEIDGGFGARRH